MGWDKSSKESRSFSYVKLKLKMKTVEIVGRLMNLGAPSQDIFESHWAGNGARDSYRPCRWY